MPDALRTIRVVTSDDAVLASIRTAIDSDFDFFGGWNVERVDSQDDLLNAPPAATDVLIVDGWARGRNVYEYLRQILGRARCRTYLLVERENDLAEPIARFCGATGVLRRPLNATSLRASFEAAMRPPAPLLSSGRSDGISPDYVLPEALLQDISTGQEDRGLTGAVTDPATGLFNYGFLNYKLDEEFKRAQRFEMPLACVMLGFEGQADGETLRELCGIFLTVSRDTDVLGRFDENSFLFLLPNTGPDGAEIMARRVVESAEERGLKDLVGDPIELSIGIANFPQQGLVRREDLYGHAREAFLAARADGGGVRVAVAT